MKIINYLLQYILIKLFFFICKIIGYKKASIFGELLGKIISPIVLAVIFFTVVTPIGIIMKILKKDLLNLKYNKNKSYWIKKNGPKSKMKNQF